LFLFWLSFFFLGFFFQWWRNDKLPPSSIIFSFFSFFLLYRLSAIRKFGVLFFPLFLSQHKILFFLFFNSLFLVTVALGCSECWLSVLSAHPEWSMETVMCFQDEGFCLLDFSRCFVVHQVNQ
jgi:hypothetical protein